MTSKYASHMGWHNPDCRQKAQDALTEKYRSGHVMQYNINIKPIDEDREAEAMRGVDYGR